MTIYHTPSSYIATWFGAGNAPKAPGTWGSLAALPLGYILHEAYGSTALLIAAFITFVVGVVATDRYMAEANITGDPKEVVIDEVSGMWLVLAFVPMTLTGYAIAFALFRFFDILKPFPISWADKHIKGAFGVMLDDTLAGIAGIVVYLAAARWLF
jgi:phosphatidylglycerophosphatase A